MAVKKNIGDGMDKVLEEAEIEDLNQDSIRRLPQQL